MSPVPTLASSVRALAAALLLACTGMAQARSSVQLDGLSDVPVGQLRNAGGGTWRRMDSGNVSTRCRGVRSAEDPGGTLRARAQLDGVLLIGAGHAVRVPGVDAFWPRNAWVGRPGGCGTGTLGRSATAVVGDTAWSNAVACQPPRLGGFSGHVPFTLGEKAANARGRDLGASVTCFGGPVGVTAAFPGFESQTAWQLGASYDLGVTKPFARVGQAGTEATADMAATNHHLGAAAPLGAGAILAAGGRSRIETRGAPTEPRSTMVTVGDDHRLSERTDAHALLPHDRFTALDSGSTPALGLRHAF